MSSKRRPSDTLSLFELTEPSPNVAQSGEPADEIVLRQQARREARKAEKRFGKDFTRIVGISLPLTTRPVVGHTGGYLSVGELAARWSVGKSTIWRWCKDGDIPLPVQIGKGATRWWIDDIEAYELSRRETVK